MDTARNREANLFGGQYHSHGGSQFIGNNFNTTGPIIFHSSPDDQIPTSVYEVPELRLSPRFTGRGDELKEIKHALNDDQNKNPARCVVHGMGGLGKTQLALKYAILASKERQYSYVFWVSAASVEKLNRDYSNLVDLLHLPGRHNLAEMAKLRVVREWLEDDANTRSWLLVLDNVNQETVFTLRDILPRKNSQGKFLFTTRTEKVAESLSMVHGQGHEIALQVPSTDDAIIVLLAGADLHREDLKRPDLTDIKSLVKSVGSLPLAIDQTASYMRETGCSAKDILNVYKKEEVEEILTWENDISQHEEKSVAAMFAPAFRKLQEDLPDAITLLRIFAFLDPESISMSMLKLGSEALQQENSTELDSNQKLRAAVTLLQSQVRLSKAIQEIQRWSLAAQMLDESDRVIRIHDLVQLLIRVKLMANAERARWLQIAICITCKSFEQIGDHSSPLNWVRCGKLVTHIQVLERFGEEHNLKSAKLMDACTRAAEYFDVRGLYQEAMNMNERTWIKKRCVLGPEHRSTLISMANLASTYRSQGRLKDAEKLGTQLMNTDMRTLGKNHLQTMYSMGNLATTMSAQGRWKEAENLDRQVMENFKKTLGNKHPQTLTSIASLSSTFWHQGRWKEAEKLDSYVMDIQKEVLPTEHPSILRSMGIHATTIWSHGRQKEANELDLELLEIRTRVLGTDHPDTLISMRNLAGIYRYHGLWEKAEELGLQVIETQKRLLGEDHTDTLQSMDVLTYTYSDQGLWRKAEKLGAQVREARKRLLGEEHPETLKSMLGLSKTYRNQGRLGRAQDLGEQVMKARKKKCGERHSETLMSMSSLAQTYLKQRKLKKAEQLEAQAAKGLKQILGETHIETLISIGHLASIYREQGRLQEAAQLGVQATTGLEMLDKDSLTTVRSMTGLSSTYKIQERWEMAEELDVKVLKIRRKIFGAEHPKTLKSTNHLASTLRNLGQYERAEALERQVMDANSSTAQTSE